MMIKIDGSIGEGGGQVVRTACSLSVVTGQPCHISNIRQMDKGGGLRPQHLGSIEILAQMSNAQVEHAELGSPELMFKPQTIKGGSYKINIKTAGSIALVLQTLLPPALFAGQETLFTIDGGATDTFFCPTINHFELVFLNLLQQMGVGVNIDVKRRGFYPKGGALVNLTVQPSDLKAINLVNAGALKKIRVLSGATKDLKKVAERQISGLKQTIGKLNLPLEEEIIYHEAKSSGSYLDIIVQMERSTLGVNSLGKMGRSPEEVGQRAGQKLIEEMKTNTPLDKYTADQLLPYLALTKKRSRIKTSHITEHALTSMEIIEMFIEGEFEIRDKIITWFPH